MSFAGGQRPPDSRLKDDEKKDDQQDDQDYAADADVHVTPPCWRTPTVVTVTDALRSRPERCASIPISALRARRKALIGLELIDVPHKLGIG